MNYDLITTDAQLSAFSEKVTSAQFLGFDTEFVSEYTYHPELCLIQVVTDGDLAVIDPQPIGDVRPFWQALIERDQETIVHAGREEYRFCVRAVGTVPQLWFDVQLAAGMVGLEYPSSYAKLLSRLLGQSLPKGETRTDWRKRPLTLNQLEYALQDVLHLIPLRDRLRSKLEAMGRLEWYEGEARTWRDNVDEGETRERWRRVNGISKLSAKSLSIVRELWRWRDEEAQHRDCLPRRVLRDDLLVELARRGRSDEKQIQAIRGMQRRDLKRHTPKISQAIDRALEQGPISLPKSRNKDLPPQITILAQFLNTALTSMCRRESIAPGLVGTTRDIRDLIVYHLKLDKRGDVPTLATGWREELVGRQLVDLLDGRLAMRLTDPLSNQPLSFE